MTGDPRRRALRQMAGYASPAMAASTAAGGAAARPARAATGGLSPEPRQLTIRDPSQAGYADAPPHGSYVDARVQSGSELDQMLWGPSGWQERWRHGATPMVRPRPEAAPYGPQGPAQQVSTGLRQQLAPQGPVAAGPGPQGFVDPYAEDIEAAIRRSGRR